MKPRILNFRVGTLIAVGAMICFGSAVYAKGRGWESGSRYTRMYDPATVDTVSGEVVKIDKITPVKGWSYGVHLLLKTDKEEISVHLGPGWYVEKQGGQFAPGDRIEVKGSRITYKGKPVIIASEVRKSDKVLQLRDDNGLPLWSKSRNR